MVHLPQTRLLLEKNNIIYPLAPFMVQNFKKILTANPELWGCPICFGPKMTHFPRQEFLGKPINKSSKTLCLGHFGLFLVIFACWGFWTTAGPMNSGLSVRPLCPFFFSDNCSKDFSDFVYDYGSLWVGWSDSPFSG